MTYNGGIFLISIELSREADGRWIAETGVPTGSEVTTVVYGRDRDEAIANLLDVLEDYYRYRTTFENKP